MTETATCIAENALTPVPADAEIWTVIGAGMAGMSVLARLANSHRMRTYDIDEAKVGAIQRAGGLHVEGGNQPFAPVELATTNMADAVADAAIIIVCTYGNLHEEVATDLAPILRDGQTIVLIQGNFAGALHFRRALEAAGCQATVDVAEMNASPFGVKILARDKVLLTGVKAHWQLCASPGARTGAILQRVGHAFPNMTGAGNLLACGFADIGALFHAGGMVTNAGHVEGPEGYHFYAANMVPAVCNLLEALDAERLAVAKAFGLDLPDACSWLASTYRLRLQPLRDMLRQMASGAYKYAPAPKSFEHRFVAQDVPCTLVPMSELGKVAGTDTRVLNAVIDVAGVLANKDFRAEGRNLYRLGLADLSIESILNVAG